MSSAPDGAVRSNPCQGIATSSTPAAGTHNQSQTPFNCYTDYLETLLPEWPEYGWLLRFLRQPEPDTETFLSILDYSNDAVCCKEFTAGSSDWAPSLEICAANVRLRILILSFQYGDVARSMINHLGVLYDLDPLFLWTHFDQAPSFKNMAVKKKSGCEYGPQIALSASSTPQVGFWPFDHTSVKILDSSILGTRIPKTVLIIMSEGHEKSQHALLFERPSLRSLGSCVRKTSRDSSRHTILRAELLAHKQQQISTLIERPLSAVLPVLKLYINHRSNHVFQDIRQCEEDCPLQLARPMRTNDCFSLHVVLLKRHHDSFRQTIRSIEATCRPTTGPKKARRDFDIHLKDMQDIIQQIESAQDNLARHHDNCTSFAAVQDSHKSVRYADSVGRLTILAFLFIPLSFVTSVFGMNLAEFGNGEVRFWVVIPTAAGLILIILFAWSISGWVLRHLRQVRTRLACFWTNYHLWKTLAKQKPIGGFWLVIFALTHTPYNYEWLLWVLNLRNLENSKETLDTPDRATQETLMRRFLSKFWWTKTLGML